MTARPQEYGSSALGTWSCTPTGKQKHAGDAQRLRRHQDDPETGPLGVKVALRNPAKDLGADRPLRPSPGGWRALQAPMKRPVHAGRKALLNRRRRRARGLRGRRDHQARARRSCPPGWWRADRHSDGQGGAMEARRRLGSGRGVIRVSGVGMSRGLGDDQRGLAQRGPRDGLHPVHGDARRVGTGRLHRGGYPGRDQLVGRLWRSGKKDRQLGGAVLAHPPPCRGWVVEDLVEDVG